MNNKILILITSEDPLWESQTFIKNEIETISSFYKHIFIFSESRTSKKPFLYKGNCEVVGLRMNGRFKYIRFITRNLFGKKTINDEKPVGLKKKIFRLYEKGKAVFMFKRITKYLSKRISADDELVIYSYWLLNTATCAVLLNNYFVKQGLNSYCFSRTHGYDLYSERNSMNYLPLQKYNVANLSYIFPCSEDGALYLKNKYCDYKNKIKVARLGTLDYGVEQFQKSETIHFVTCSNLIPLKRVDIFASAFAKLQKKYDVFWTCIGDGKEKEKIRSILLENDVDSNKFVLKGKMSNKDILNYYKNNKIDFFVNVSKFEGVPVSIMEAMSFGIPVIATDVGGTHELVNEKNGLLINSDLDSDILFKVLESQMLSYELSKRDFARTTWEIKSSAKTNYERFHNKIISNNFDLD